jgi:hypothetical protein
MALPLTRQRASLLTALVAGRLAEEAAMTDREKSEGAEWDFRVAQLALLTALAQKLTGRKVTVFLENAPAGSTHGGNAKTPVFSGFLCLRKCPQSDALTDGAAPTNRLES